jgi:hypothetical protein
MQKIALIGLLAAAGLATATQVSAAAGCAGDACKEVRVVTRDDGCTYVSNLGKRKIKVQLGKVGKDGGKFAVINSVPPGQTILYTLMGKCFEVFLGGEYANYE